MLLVSLHIVERVRGGAGVAAQVFIRQPDVLHHRPGSERLRVVPRAALRRASIY